LPPEFLSSGRLLVAVVILFPLFIRDKRRYPEFPLLKGVKLSCLPATLLTFHFITWTIGARWTTSVNSTLIVNLIPVAMPFLSWYLLKEPLKKTEWIGTFLAVLGVLVLAIVDYRISSKLIIGDLVCIVSMILMAWYLIMARKHKDIPSIWLYLVPLYIQAGVLCLIAGIIRTELPNNISWREWQYVLLLGIIPTIFGHSLLNMAMQWFRSQLVAIVSQMQFIYAGVLGYLFFSEIPHGSFYLASAFMMTGVLWTLLCTKLQNHGDR
jgi:drug/metabolite transporter (DMT)-like permease